MKFSSLEFYKFTHNLSYLFIFLLLTLFIELVTVLISKNGKKYVRALIIANLITNPIANLIMPGLYSMCLAITKSKLAQVIICWCVYVAVEIGVIFGEAYILRFFTQIKYSTCIKYSVIVNLVSCISGSIIMDILNRYLY